MIIFLKNGVGICPDGMAPRKLATPASLQKFKQFKQLERLALPVTVRAVASAPNGLIFGHHHDTATTHCDHAPRNMCSNLPTRH